MAVSIHVRGFKIEFPRQDIHSKLLLTADNVQSTRVKQKINVNNLRVTASFLELATENFAVLVKGFHKIVQNFQMEGWCEETASRFPFLT